MDDSQYQQQKGPSCFVEELCNCEEEPISNPVLDSKKKEKVNHVISSSA